MARLAWVMTFAFAAGAAPAGCGVGGFGAGSGSGGATMTPPVIETAPEVAGDPVVLSFVFVGCNRVGFSEEAGLPLPKSTANEPQLLQTFTDVAALATTPSHLFLCGDIVRNEQPGTMSLHDQLKLWQGLWDNGALAGSTTLTLVPFTGNHEVLVSRKYWDVAEQAYEYYEVPNGSAYGTWLAWLSANGHFPAVGNGPGTGGPDLLVGDNSRLTYSFDAPTANGKHAHFIVVSTDSHSTFSTTDPACYQPPQADVTHDGTTAKGTMTQPVPGWVPLDWLRKDIDAAVADATTDVIFVLGHKPILDEGTTPATESTGRDTIFNCGSRPLAAGLFASFQKAQKAGKFGGYLCAHQHLWSQSQLDAAGGAPIWQVIAGNGGTKIQPGQAKQFGFTVVDVFRSGKVTATPHVRPEPSPYYADTATPAAADPGNAVTLRAASN